MFAEDSPAKGECEHTVSAGGGDERVLENCRALIQDDGWGLGLVSDTPWGIPAEPAAPGGW